MNPTLSFLGGQHQRKVIWIGLPLFVDISGLISYFGMYHYTCDMARNPSHLIAPELTHIAKDYY
jgi:hypothetical protein